MDREFTEDTSKVRGARLKLTYSTETAVLTVILTSVLQALKGLQIILAASKHDVDVNSLSLALGQMSGSVLFTQRVFTENMVISVLCDCNRTNTGLTTVFCCTS